MVLELHSLSLYLVFLSLIFHPASSSLEFETRPHLNPQTTSLPALLQQDPERSSPILFSLPTPILCAKETPPTLSALMHNIYIVPHPTPLPPFQPRPDPPHCQYPNDDLVCDPPPENDLSGFPPPFNSPLTTIDFVWHNMNIQSDMRTLRKWHPGPVEKVLVAVADHVKRDLYNITSVAASRHSFAIICATWRMRDELLGELLGF